MNSNQLKLKILQLCYNTKCTHIGSILSCLDIIQIIYQNIDYNIDNFVLSKGHAGLALYTVLCNHDLMSLEQLNTYYTNGSFLHGHVSHHASNVYISTGALGHGASIACGIALAKKLKKQNGKIYTVIGDGECNEGSIWQMAMFASANNLDNLVAIIDNNKLQALGQLIDKNDLKQKWVSFGWQCFNINGHNKSDLKYYILKQQTKPKCLIANTIKGCGISFMQNNNDWHYNVISEQVYNKAIKEVQSSL